MSIRFAVEDEAYQGPLHVLLTLAERGEIDLERLALARLADRYLEQVRSMAPLPLEEIGEFLYMGARLVRLKLEEAWMGEIPEEALDLRTELRLLESLEAAARELRDRQGGRVYGRPEGIVPRTGSADDLVQAMHRMARRRQTLLPPPERTQRREGIRLAAITAALERRLGTGPVPLEMRDWPWGVRGMVLFASLELTWRRRAHLHQDRPFAALTVLPREHTP